MFKLIPQKIVMTLLMCAAVLFAGTAGYMLIEKWGFLDSLYMTTITLATIGYGETHPLSNWGRVFTIILIFGGIGVLAYVIQMIISFFLEGELGDIMRRQKMEKHIKAISNHYIICAKGETARYVIEEFVKTQQSVVIVTQDQEIEKIFSAKNMPIIFDNPANDNVLESAGISTARGLVAVLGEDKENLFVVLSARGLNAGIKIITQAIEENSVLKFKKAGADEVVLTDAISGMRMASAMLRPAVVTFLDTMLRDPERMLRVEEVTVQDKSVLKGKTLEQADIRGKYGAVLLAVRENASQRYLHNPGNDYLLKPNDTLILIGTPDQVKQIQGQ